MNNDQYWQFRYNQLFGKRTYVSSGLTFNKPKSELDIMLGYVAPVTVPIWGISQSFDYFYCFV